MCSCRRILGRRVGAFLFAGFGLTPHAQAEQLFLDIRDAIRREACEVRYIRGSSDEGLNCGPAIVMEVQNRVSEDIQVTVRRGQLLLAKDPRIPFSTKGDQLQDMVVASDATFRVDARSCHRVTLNVFCVNMNKNPPGRSDSYSLGDEAQGELGRLLETINRNGLLGERAAQLAIWAVTDDADERGILRKPFGALAGLFETHKLASDAERAQQILDASRVQRKFDDPFLGAHDYYAAIANAWAPVVVPALLICVFGIACVICALHRRKRKSAGVAYLLWFFFGGLAFHKFYLRKTALGVLYIISAGLLGVGLLVDLFTIPSQVRRFNTQLEEAAVGAERYCGHCGKGVSKAFTFCPSCGKKV
jgi:hypothetical protein